MFENDSVYADFLETLAKLTLDSEDFEVALFALKLQTALSNTYGTPL